MSDINITCERCGLEFTVDRHKGRTRYCQECKLEVRREQIRKSVKKSKNKRDGRKRIDMSLEAVTALQEKYNREHGTYLSYGKFVEKMKNGEIYGLQ